MTVDFTCQRCEGSFELEYGELAEGSIECPNCDAKAPKKMVDELTSALDDLLGRVRDLRGKFAITLAIESDELPGQFGASDEADDDDDLDEDLDEDDSDDDVDEEEPDEDEDR